MALDRTAINKRLTYIGLDNAQRDAIAKLILELQDQVTAAVSTNTSQATSISNLNAWATALATKLNADAGVTDTNYDTTPQS